MKNELLLTAFILGFLTLSSQVQIDKDIQLNGTSGNRDITGAQTMDVSVGYLFGNSPGTSGQVLRSNGSTGFVAANLQSGDIPNLDASKITTGVIGVARGGTGTGTALTQGSVVFAGVGGVYTQNNANFFWDNTNARLGIGTATPGYILDVADRIQLRSGASGSAGIWLQNTGNSGLVSFLGTLDDNTLGIYGVGLNNWFFYANRLTGNVGIGVPALTTAGQAKLSLSRDGVNACCGGENVTLALGESSNTTARQSSISFHNSGEAESFIRLSGGGAGARAGQRRFEIGDNQNQATTLQIQGLAGTGNRRVFADANGLLKTETIVSTTSGIATTGYGTGNINDPITTGNMTVVTGDVIDIEGWLRVNWNGGTGDDRVVVTISFVNGTGGCGSGTIGTNLIFPSHQTGTSSDNYVKQTWTASCSGTVQFRVSSLARENADDTFRWVNSSRFRAIKQ